MSLVAPLALTLGEPAGIGPDIAIQLVQKGLECPVVFVGSSVLLEQRAQQLGLRLRIKQWQGELFSDSAAEHMWVVDVALAEDVTPGELNERNAAYVLKCLDVAIEGSISGQFSGLVTAPVHKGIVNDAGIAFSGHTEYLQEKCAVERVVMMLASPAMRVALVTTHLPLKGVAESINQERLTQVLDILINDLEQKFGCQNPAILVAGLNPHAGESGHMGREEIDVIEPVLAGYRQRGIEVSGPLPADTLFTPKYLEHADAVLAMYHDQGLPVLKYQSFGEAVNITLGLPIIRTSVDHGTALDLAGTGRANSGSLQCAVATAAEMALAMSQAS